MSVVSQDADGGADRLVVALEADRRAVGDALRDGADVVVAADALAGLAAIPDGCVQSVVTSPPYWSLRDYNTVGQTGRAETLDEYLDALLAVFDETARILTKNGTLWVNIGDAYTSGRRKYRAADPKNPARAMTARPVTPRGLKAKELVGLPWRFATAMQAAGWWWRADIIWYKPNCQPESVKDRPTRSYEHVLLFARSERYFYDRTAVVGPGGRQLRDVWDIVIEHAGDGHPAAYPLELAERCIRLATRPGDLVCDPYLGSGTTMQAARLLSRRSVGCEINSGYLDLISTRSRRPKPAGKARRRR